MTQTALILAAHGAGETSDANALVRGLADSLHARGRFAEVAAAFNLGAPRFAEALEEVRAERVVVVPVMTSEGYFSESVLPRELARSAGGAARQVRITPPVGTHRRIADILADLAGRMMQEFELDAADTTLIVVGHGTERHRRSREATERLCETLRARGLCAAVQPAFLDEAPRVEAAPTRAVTTNLIVIPFLIGGGYHATHDIPERLGLTPADDGSLPVAGRAADRFMVCTEALGRQAALVEIIEQMAFSAFNASNDSARPPADDRPRPVEREVLRLGTRASALALWQAGHVAEKLRAMEVSVELIEISTHGDRDLDSPIYELGSAAPFSDEIEEALLRGEIDIAVHSLKDLPVEGRNGLVIAAVLERGDPREALVSRGNLTLAQLPPSAMVGTSSPRRAAQLKHLRPDLETAPIRGPVEDRVRQVRRGAFDAAVLAAAGLERLGLLHEAAEFFEVDHFMPAPAQAALAVQARRADREILKLIHRLEHAPSRRTVTAELEFLRPYESNLEITAAAHATVRVDEIRMHARLTAADGTMLWDAIVCGRDPIGTARLAIRQAERALALTSGACP